jgi:hypothetical protein
MITRSIAGAVVATASSTPSCEHRKPSKLSDQHATLRSYSIITCSSKHMLNRNASFYRSLFRPAPITRYSTSAFSSMVTTRNRTYTYDTVPQGQGGVEVATESLGDRRTRWARLLRSHHYEPVIAEVLEKEMCKYETGTIINATDRLSYTGECARILASAPSILAAAVEGDLVRRLKNEPGLQEEYASICKRAESQPSIYVHLLADRHGTAPTPNQYLTIRDFVVDYLTQGEDSEHAWQIDNVSRPLVSKQSSARGHRKYLQTSNCSRSTKRVSTFELFCQGAQKRWHETPASLHDTPFRHPPGECGYSVNSHERLKQHRAHQSSNYVMNLVEDISTYLYKAGILDQHFTMHQFIIYLIFRKEQAAIAEIFCSGLLQVWVENGGGFNAYNAGLSVATANRISDVAWALHEQNTTLHSPILDNLREQQRKADEWRQALDWTYQSNVDSEINNPVDQEEECM